ncbi:hypothetical protein PG999_003149 [Apiospora kogelbergensis]|uniref:Clr5 domain-containing protein n=1 Tax=Apiospora kogelbergensis TaxID=1337665 RepID=A0AAW0RA54_9PEZI
MASKRSQTNREWDSFRPDIERMFSKEMMKLEDIVAWLGQHGFHTNKNKLAYKLNTTWKLRQRAPRGQAGEYWKAASELVMSRQRNGDPATGSLVGGNGQRMRLRNLQRQIRRNVIETHLSNFGPSLQSHTGLSLTLRSPTPERVEFHIRWPSNLPWLASAVQKLQIRADANSQASWPVFHAFPPEAFNLASDELGNAQARKQAVQNLASQIPEEEGDALRRAQVVLSDRTPEALAEALKLLVFKLSNGFINLRGELGSRDLKIFNFLVYLLDHLGITKTPIKLRHEDFTMRAFRDTLYKGIFLSLWTTPLDLLSEVLFDYDKICSAVEWLLRSGQSANTTMDLSTVSRGNGLNIALCLSMGKLANILLDHGVEPLHDHGQSIVFNQIDLHPLFLAVFCLNVLDEATLERIENYGLPHDNLKFDELHPVTMQPRSRTPMMFILDKLSEDHGFSIVQYLFEHVDSSNGVPYREVVNWSDLLVHASFSGRTSILEFLLSRYHLIPHHGHSTIHEFVNLPTKSGITALCAATASKLNSAQTCQILLQNGATVEPQETPSKFQHPLELLLHHYEARGRASRSFVVEYEQTKDLKLFITSNVDLYHPDHPGPSWNEVDLRSMVVEQGHDIPPELVDIAMGLLDVGLLSLILELDPKIRGHNLPSIYNIPKPPLGSDFIYPSTKTKISRREIARLLFEAGAPSSPGDAVLAAFHGDWDLVTRILEYYPTNGSKDLQASIDDWENPVTILEAALLSGSRSVAEKAFTLNPSQFSAGALCAATLEASTSNDHSMVRSLLNNRDKQYPIERSEACMAMTAIGIAAYKGSWELLRLLKAHLPWSKQAFIPDHSTIRTTLRNFPQKLSEFWHSDIEGDAQVFAFKSEMEIFNLFANDHILIPSTLSLLIEEGMEHRIQSLARLGYRVQALPHEYIQPHGCSPLHQAIDKDSASLVQACLDLGLDINGCYQGTVDGIWGSNTACTPLAYSILENRLDIANLLIKNGAYIHSIGNGWYGVTPLQAASSKIELGMAMKLLQLGADTNSPGSYRDSKCALECAASHGRLDMVALLLLNGTDTQNTGRLSYIRAILRASYGGYTQVYELLRSHRPWDATDEELFEHEDLLDGRMLPDGISETTTYDEWKATLESREGASELSASSEEVSGPASKQFMDEDAPTSSALAEDGENAMDVSHPEGVWTVLDDQDLHEKAIVSQTGLVKDVYWGSDVIEGSSSTLTLEELDARI